MKTGGKRLSNGRYEDNTIFISANITKMGALLEKLERTSAREITD